MDLARLFATLRPPADTASDLRFAADGIDGNPRHRIAVDRHGLPALLIGVVDSEVSGPPLVLEHIRMQQGVDCRISEPDGVTLTQRFAIIRCTTGDPVTCDYFLRVSGTVLEAIGPDPTSERVSRTLERLVDLFRALTAPPRKSVIGFWGELFVISSSKDVQTMMRAWRASPSERFDFSLEGQRLEVKATLGRVRRHHFSLEQVVPAESVDVLIASVLLERSGSGPSVSELIDAIRSWLEGDPAVLLHLDTVVAETLGSGWRHALDERFDAELAAATLAFFEPGIIPKPPGPVPPMVTEVRFVADLSACHTVSAGRYSSGSGLLAAATRRRTDPLRKKPVAGSIAVPAPGRPN